jgi:HSP20 family protein
MQTVIEGNGPRLTTHASAEGGSPEREPTRSEGYVERKRQRDELQREIQELFSDLWQVPRFSGLRSGFRPHADCFRTEDSLTVIVELPGVDPDAVDIVVADGNLYLVGKRDRPRGEGQVYQQMEIDYGTFRRQIALNADVDVAKAHASYDRGLLTIVLPLAQRPPAPEKVTIVVTRS